MKFRIYRSPDGDGGAGAGAGAGDGTAVNINHQAGGSGAPVYTPPAIAIMDAAPPEFREKPYLKNIKDIPSLFKEFDGLQTKLGQRPSVGAPAADAKPEEVEAFYNSLTPKDAKEYQIPETEFSKNNPRDAKFLDGMKEIFKKSGMSQYHAGKFLPLAEEYLAQYTAGLRDENDAKFETEIKTQFGAELEPSMKAAKELIADNIPKELLPRLEKMTNDDLLLMTVMAKNLHDKYIKEDSVLKNQRPAGGGDVNALYEEARKLQLSPEYQDFRRAGHDAAVKRVEELYQQIAGLEKVVPK